MSSFYPYPSLLLLLLHGLPILRPLIRPLRGLGFRTTLDSLHREGTVVEGRQDQEELFGSFSRIQGLSCRGSADDDSNESVFRRNSLRQEKVPILVVIEKREMKPRNRPDEEEAEYSPWTPRNSWSIGLIKFVSFLVIFMAGIIIGLSLSAHFTRSFNSQTEIFFPKTMYTTNCDKECLGFKGFLSPAHLMHSMSDKELFWRVSMAPKMKEYPFERVPKVAFMFMARGPLPLARLWDRFFKGHEGLYSVYLHTIPDYKLDASESSAFYGRQIPSEEVSWGSVTLVDAEKRLLANALLDFSNERFVLLSESCIPVYDFPTVYEYLINSAHSFVESYDENSQQGRGRYSRHMFPTIKLHQWRKGSEWFELNRELAVNLVADYKYYSIFSKYCKPSCYPDEHYIPTFLNMFHGSLNANRTITWVDWSRGGPHPATYGAPNITPDFIQSIRNNGTSCMYNSRPTSVCFLFARKFAPSALDPLLNLTSTVMGF
ncbi:KH [Musa troglodytarum]|uniref:KH n=1 Tax=Musa troglodytarum TaxID=320322 RepID=A0A9E7H2U0_9LILI|nr:KH [Musa troglodytarum]